MCLAVKYGWKGGGRAGEEEVKGGGQVRSWGRAASVVWFRLGLERTQRARFHHLLNWVTRVEAISA